MAKAKAKAKTQAASSSFCNLLKRGIKEIEKDLITDGKNITAQENFIRQLRKEQAKPALIKQAEERLAMLQNKLELDEAQLSAFQDEFAADCH